MHKLRKLDSKSRFFLNEKEKEKTERLLLFDFLFSSKNFYNIYILFTRNNNKQ